MALSRRCHFIRIQTAEVNATKRLLRGAGWVVGTRGSPRNASRWERLINALAVEPELHDRATRVDQDGPMKSSRASPDFVIESLTQDTR
jgi:hypothetical protein